MKPPIEYRPQRPFMAEAHRMTAREVKLEPGSVNLIYLTDAAEQLAHKRSLKAAQMRRYRARKKLKHA